MAKKKNTKSKEKNEVVETTNNNKSLTDKIIIISGILIFLLSFYLLTLYITNKHSDSSSKNDTEEDQVVSISYDDIVLGRSLSMSDGEYLVIYYEGDNEDVSSTYDEMVSNYNTKDEHLKLYYVDMSSAFNSSFSTQEESNKNPESVTDFKINGPTLIKVNENKVVEYIEGESDIRDFLES